MRYFLAFVLLACSITFGQLPSTQPTPEQSMAHDEPVAQPAARAVNTVLGNGRFQLLQSSVSSIDVDRGGVIVEEKMLFKIDTLTGVNFSRLSAYL